MEFPKALLIYVVSISQKLTQLNLFYFRNLLCYILRIVFFFLLSNHGTNLTYI